MGIAWYYHHRRHDRFRWLQIIICWHTWIIMNTQVLPESWCPHFSSEKSEISRWQIKLIWRETDTGRSGNLWRNSFGPAALVPVVPVVPWWPRLCWAPTSFQLTTELYPQELRQHGLALSHAGLPSRFKRQETSRKTCRGFTMFHHVSPLNICATRCSTTASRLEHELAPFVFILKGNENHGTPYMYRSCWFGSNFYNLRQRWTHSCPMSTSNHMQPVFPKLNHKCPILPLFSVLCSSMQCTSPSASPTHSQHFTSFSHHFPMIFHYFPSMFPSSS